MDSLVSTNAYELSLSYYIKSLGGKKKENLWEYRKVDMAFMLDSTRSIFDTGDGCFVQKPIFPDVVISFGMNSDAFLITWFNFSCRIVFRNANLLYSSGIFIPLLLC